MKRARLTYVELKAENVRLQVQVAELEDLVRRLTQQLAGFLQSGGQRRSAISQVRGNEGMPEGAT